MVDYGPFEMEMYDGTVYKYPAGAQWVGRSIFNFILLEHSGLAGRYLTLYYY